MGPGNAEFTLQERSRDRGAWGWTMEGGGDLESSNSDSPVTQGAERAGVLAGGHGLARVNPRGHFGPCCFGGGRENSGFYYEKGT